MKNYNKKIKYRGTAAFLPSTILVNRLREAFFFFATLRKERFAVGSGRRLLF